MFYFIKKSLMRQMVLMAVAGSVLPIIILVGASLLLAEEAFSSPKDWLWYIMLLLIPIILVGGLTGYLFARSVCRPLAQLSTYFSEVAEGDLTLTMTTERLDEIGSLIRSVGQMVEASRNQHHLMTEGANSLASSISQIGSTSSELAASSVQTSTTIAEVSATVEEVRHTAHLVNDKAMQMVEEFVKLTEVAKQGGKSSSDSITGIKKIDAEVEYIAESTIKLSEQTQYIGEIIGAVNDLTDQSNLLSVNASIEAAKAGDVGKGFAVVAQEVKSLAEQSREATGQIKTILGEIQKATSAAVMATERGSKAVEIGVTLNNKTGEAITVLENSINTSSVSSEQIGASSQQQLAGMDQLVVAMENIRQAAAQGETGAKQLENATQSLRMLAQNMQTLSSRFKI